MVNLLRFSMFCMAVFLVGFAMGYLDYSPPAEQPRDTGIPPEVIHAIMKAESGGNAMAVGRDGERGAFQFTEKTWKALTDEPFSEAFNIKKSARIAVKNLLQAKTTDPKRLIAYHNAGTTRWETLNKRWTVNHPNRIYREIYRGRNP